MSKGKNTKSNTKKNTSKKITKNTKEYKEGIIIPENDVNIEIPKKTKKTVKLEEAKTKPKNKKLLFIGFLICVLGIIALLLSIIANRIIDRNFLNDSSVLAMIIISIIIECFGAFIIISES